MTEVGEGMVGWKASKPGWRGREPGRTIVGVGAEILGGASWEEERWFDSVGFKRSKKRHAAFRAPEKSSRSRAVTTREPDSFRPRV